MPRWAPKRSVSKGMVPKSTCAVMPRCRNGRRQNSGAKTAALRCCGPLYTEEWVIIPNLQLFLWTSLHQTESLSNTYNYICGHHWIRHTLNRCMSPNPTLKLYLWPLPHQSATLSNTYNYICGIHWIKHTKQLYESLSNTYNYICGLHCITHFKQLYESLSNTYNYICGHNLISHTLNLKTASVIPIFLVHSKLDYCNFLYLSLPQDQLFPVTVKLACLCNNGNHQIWKHDLYTQVTIWLKNEECIHYIIISVTCDLLHTFQPQYLRKLVHIKTPGSTRSSDHFTLLLSAKFKLSNHFFIQSAPVLWNNLPKSMGTFSNTPPNFPFTDSCSSLLLSFLNPIPLLAQNLSFQHLIPYPP